MLAAYLIGLVVLIWFLLFYNLPAIAWLIAGSLITFGTYYFAYALNLTWVGLFWCFTAYIVFINFFIVLAFKPLRRHLITKSLLPKLKKQLPKISATEEQAIEAGDVWWEGDIFAAKLNWCKYADHHLTELSNIEKEFIDQKVNKLCELLDEWNIVTQDKDLNLETWQFIRQNKFFAIVIPKEYGGLEFSAAAHAAIVTKIASKSVTAAVTIMVPNALGPGELLMHYGTAEQKLYYLPRLASGEEIPCFALTSPHAGSDAGGMTDNGIICKQVFNGQEVLGIKLNFSKRYITLAPVATVMGLAFKLYDPDKLYSKNTDLGVTLALIPTNYEGIEIGNRHLAMMIPFQNGPIRGHDVFIPMDYIIGGPEYIGKGWFMLMECLSGGRGISLPALSTATCQAAYLSSFTYSHLRTQFKAPIAKLEGIQEQLAKLTGYCLIANSVQMVTASAIDHGMKPAVISAITKYHLTELSRKAINAAMDIHGGKAVMCGPLNYLANAYIANPIAITVEGANILTRNLIIFGQGAFRAHPYVLEEIIALNERNSSIMLRKFDRVLFHHIKFTFSILTRLKTYNLQRFFYKFTKKNNWLKAYQKDLTRLSCSLALSTDMALLFIGGKLKFKERLSARLGDTVSYIYMAVCVIKAYQDKKDKNNKHDPVVKWALDYCLYNAQSALIDYSRNFPVKVIGKWLKIVMFPWGASYKEPSDKQDTEVLNNSQILDDLTNLVYKNPEFSQLGFLNHAYQQQANLQSNLMVIYNLANERKIAYSNDLSKMVDDAYSNKLILEEDFNNLKVFAGNLNKIINVDEFTAL
ncbi:MAG: acyl-CoA dehydrogenase [Gammaproteobacteria bacterium]|nr:acyl-CoA dehydrogenase [Gammaproteobacteria bacterium]